ncbi:hypothetical protein ASF28_08955 [Methylobacterium sp. Leaf99]|uniref:major capsid protein n=1 Tax=Methylobacterium sp. Leaf99 TaxID=1736251 RepID=UPI0006FAAE43|nr:major capsid protein [Methylobacterium sp. Leaf99]KQP11162.1 hypothetical protein ASF28_08955 [Methylobacterium sp. Leaf99]
MSLVYDTHTLARVMDERIDTPSTFLLDLFFGTTQNFDTETIDFDLIKTGRKLAPFVHPDASAKPTNSGGYITKSFKPANVKLLEVVKPGRAMKRMAGERYSGDMSPVERMDAVMVDVLAAQERAVLYRLEWMAAQALRFGKVKVEGEDYPSQTVDYERDESLSVNLTGAARWGETGVKPLDSIETWAQAVQDKCGIAPGMVVLGGGAWKLARQDDDFRKVLDVRRQATGNVELGPIKPDDVTRARYVGAIGDFEFWVYQQSFEQAAGASERFIDDNNVIMGSPAIEGVRAFGAIQDVGSLVPQEIFRKVYDTENPSRRNAYSESAPLVVPSRVNASFCAKVK